MPKVSRSCPGCQADMPISLKKCRGCGLQLTKKKDCVKKEELNQQYSSTPYYYLKNKIKQRADIMFAKDSEIIIIGYHHNESRDNLWSYSPPGSIGCEFLKEEAGQYAVQLFKKYVLQKGKAFENSNQLATPATDQSTQSSSGNNRQNNQPETPASDQSTQSSFGNNIQHHQQATPATDQSAQSSFGNNIQHHQQATPATGQSAQSSFGNNIQHHQQATPATDQSAQSSFGNNIQHHRQATPATDQSAQSSFGNNIQHHRQATPATDQSAQSSFGNNIQHHQQATPATDQSTLSSLGNVLQDQVATQAHPSTLSWVTYVLDGYPVAVGQHDSAITAVDNKPIPEELACVRIVTFRKEKCPQLKCGEIFCLPKHQLLRLVFDDKGNKIFKNFSSNHTE